MKKYLLICILAMAIMAPMALSAEEENKLQHRKRQTNWSRKIPHLFTMPP